MSEVLIEYKRKDSLHGLPFQSCRKEVIFLKQGIHRIALKLRVVSQIIAAIASAATAIHHSLLKNQADGGRALVTANTHPFCWFDYTTYLTKCTSK